MITTKKEPENDDHCQQTSERGDQKKAVEKKVSFIVNIDVPST